MAARNSPSPGDKDLNDDKIVCQLCGTFENLSLCAGCRETWYCCKEHQKADWKKHRGTCKKSTNKELKVKTVQKKDVNKANSSTACLDVSVDVSVGVNSEESCAPNNKNLKAVDCSNQNVLSNNGLMLNSENGKLPNIKQSGNYHSTGISHPDTSQFSKLESSLKKNELDIKQKNGRGMKNINDSKLESCSNKDTYFTVIKTRFDMLAKYVVECLSQYGICVIDNFLGDSKGNEIFEEVIKLRNSGVFMEGQLVNSASSTTHVIRGDILTWVDGSENGSQNIHFLISCMDAIISRCTGKLESYNISERTKAMVACYPGKHTGYVKHVDNPNGDGRCITCIYYLNKNWDVNKYGGMLRIYPEGQDQVANIEPMFDRLLYFWSDRRNPHEVRACSVERYAITVWYYDKEERCLALKHSKDNNGRNPRKLAVPLFSSE